MPNSAQFIDITVYTFITYLIVPVGGITIIWRCHRITISVICQNIWNLYLADSHLASRWRPRWDVLGHLVWMQMTFLPGDWIILYKEVGKLFYFVCEIFHHYHKVSWSNTVYHTFMFWFSTILFVIFTTFCLFWIFGIGLC